MAIQWKPALYNSASTDTLRFIPRPITSLDLPFQFAFSRHSVPLSDGEVTFGRKVNGVDITISGVFGVYGDLTDGEVQVCSEADMWSVVEDFTTFLAAGGREQRLEFFVYYDDVEDTYRKFKNVRPVSFVPQIGDGSYSVWPYTLQLMAEDPNIYTTEPGS